MDKDGGHGSLYRNTVSYFGGLIILISLVLIILFLLLSFALKAPSPLLSSTFHGTGLLKTFSTGSGGPESAS